MEIVFWNSVKDSKSPAVLEAYLQRFPNGTFAGLARVLIANLKDQNADAAPAKVAALPVPDVERQQDPQALARALQTELKRVGCYPGAVDGVWGGQSKEALGKFARHAKMALPTEEPTSAVLKAVTTQKDRICSLECDGGDREVEGRCVAEIRSAKKTRAANLRDEEDDDDDPPPRRSRASSERSSDEGSPLGGTIIFGTGRRRGGIGIGIGF
jgi:hypothetical protein